MSSAIHYSQCPVCGCNELKPVCVVQDYTVSKEEFTIVECTHCSLRITQDAPDATAIGKYYKADTYISHTNSSKGLVSLLYQKVRKKTLRQKRKLIESDTNIKQGQLLDIGAGTGAFVQTMQKAGWDVSGLEPDADARAVAQKDFEVTLHPIEEIEKLATGTFDAITMWHVLEHVHDLNGYMQRLKSLLKPEGKLFVAVPNYTSQDAEIYKRYWAAYDVPRHLYHFSPEAMNALVERHGLKVAAYKPMWFDSYYVSILSVKYKTGRMKLITSFFNGIRSNWQARKDVRKCSSIIYIISQQ